MKSCLHLNKGEVLKLEERCVGLAKPPDVYEIYFMSISVDYNC